MSIHDAAVVTPFVFVGRLLFIVCANGTPVYDAEKADVAELLLVSLSGKNVLFCK